MALLFVVKMAIVTLTFDVGHTVVKYKLIHDIVTLTFV